MSLPPAPHGDEEVMSMPPGAAAPAPRAASETTVQGGGDPLRVPTQRPSIANEARSPIEELTPQELEKILARHSEEWAASNYGRKPGFPASTIIVQFTSRDPACKPCIDANAKLDALMLTAPPGNRMRVVRVAWDPWQSAAQHPLIKKNVIDGLPTVMQFVMGMRHNRIVGDAEPKVFSSFLWKLSPMDMEIDWRGAAASWMRFKGK